MGAKSLEELLTYRLAREFKLEVYRLVRESPGASGDYRYRDQLFDAASGVESCVAEGFRRYGAAEFAQFLRYALASLTEAELRLKDGVDRKHFAADDLIVAQQLAKRCYTAALHLHNALKAFTKQPSSARHAPPPRPPKPRRS
jgi:four helix bundle protein